MKKELWEKFLKKGDVKSYLEFKKQQKIDIELGKDEKIDYGKNRRDNNKK